MSRKSTPFDMSEELSEHLLRPPPPSVPDCVFIFPNPYLDDEEKRARGIYDMETIDGDDFLEYIFVAKKKVALPIFSNLNEVCKGQSPTKMSVKIAMLQDFCVWFSNCGFTVKLFKSMDEDEIFMRVTIHSDQVLEFYAAKEGTRLQTTVDLVDALNVKQPTEEINPAFVKYQENLVDEKPQELGLDTLFRRYDFEGEEGSIFRKVDRIRVILRTTLRMINVEKLMTSQGHHTLVNFFPAHVKKSLDELKAEWANFEVTRLCDPTCKQPLYILRNYFGEAIAFYFAWIGFTVRFFFVLAPVGIFFKIFDLAKPFGQNHTTDISTLLWMTFIVIWTAVYIDMWKREQASHEAHWDMQHMQNIAIQRPDFRGKMKPDPCNENEKTRQFPPEKKRMLKIFSFGVTVVFLLLVLASVVFVFSLRDTLIATYGPTMGPILKGIIMSAQIKIFNAIWEMVAPALVRLENPRTDAEFSDSLIWKLFFFQAINSYNPFVYIGFFQGHSIGCPYDDCIEYLNHSLNITFFSLGLMSFLEMGVPYFKFMYLLSAEHKALLKTIKRQRSRSKGQDDKERGSVKKLTSGLSRKLSSLLSKNLTHEFRSDDGKDLPARSFIEMQGKMERYRIEDRIKDELFVVIILGYVLLFSVVVPMIAVVALIVLVFQVRTDAWKLCWVYRRPRPRVAMGIGQWTKVLDVLSWAGLVSSVAIPILNLQFFKQYSLMTKLVIFFVAKEALALLRIGLQIIIPDVPAEVELMMARRAKVVDTLFAKEDDDEKLEDTPEPPSIDPDEIEFLNENSAEWHTVEKLHEEDLAASKVIRNTVAI